MGKLINLRSIYEEVCDIFGFQYEKNRNGTVRVNTVIRKLVYPKLYSDGDYSEQEIRYFLCNDDASYQNYPNIRNSFSELMVPKSGSNRFPVMEFCDLIDIDEMYAYYRELECDPARLHAFVNGIFSDNTALHTKLLSVCNSDIEFLVWIIIFSMFNLKTADLKFEEYLSHHNHRDALITAFEPEENHRFSTFLSEYKRRLSWLKIILLFVNGAMICFVFVEYVFRNCISGAVGQTAFYTIMTVFPMIFSIIHYIYTIGCHKYYDYKTYFSYKDVFTSMKRKGDVTKDRHFVLKPFSHESALNGHRDEWRHVSVPVTIALCLLTVIPSVIFNSFPLLVILIAYILGTETLIQRTLNDRYVRLYYDRLTEEPGAECRAYRGLAKFHRWEYVKTGFDLNNEYYKNNIHMHSATCYKHIFKLSYDRFRFRLIYMNGLSFFLCACMLVLVYYTIFVGSPSMYLHLPLPFYQSIIIYVLLLGLYNMLLVSSIEMSYAEQSLFACLSRNSDSNPAATEHIFLELIASNSVRDTDWARGIFTYTLARISAGARIEDILPETDRMSSTHRTVVFRSRIRSLAVISFLMLFSLFVWHLGIGVAILPVSVFVIVTYIIFSILITKRVHLKRIIKEIQLLEEREAR